MTSNPFCIATFAALALVGCVSSPAAQDNGDDTDASDGKADRSGGASTATAATAGYYSLGVQPQSARWINDVNLHADGTFEADFGNGVSNLSGHEFSADGTFSVNSAASTITFVYTFVSPTTDTYKLKNVSGGIALEFVSSDDPSDQAWFTLAKGARPETLSFAADKSVTQSGPLVAGSTVLVEYAAARSTCAPGSSDDSPPVTMLMAVDGAFNMEQLVALPVRAIDGTYRALFTVPTGHTLAVWFELQTVDASGHSSCSAWDSNNSNNFDFDIDAT